MEDDTAGDTFCEEDIDQILQRRTQVVQLEAGEKGSTFAKVWNQPQLFNPYAGGTEYIRFQANFKPINSTLITKMFCDKCSVNLGVTF